MSLWAVLATGPSMSQEIADLVQNRCKAIVVSDSLKLAPWADALASNDGSWWRAHPEALSFAGRKFCAVKITGTERLAPEYPFNSSCNSGLFAMRVAAKLGASKLLLLGFDLKGSHFFGEHPKPLKNTTPERFRTFIRQFDSWNEKKIPVVNCTQGSALKRFPCVNLEDALNDNSIKSA